MRKNKGFTLVELLAVIVVLALIMVIAIPTVLDVSSTAQKKSFILEGQKIVNAAQTKYEADELAGKHDSTTYTFSDLGITADEYEGCVTYSVSGSQVTYTLYLSNGKWMYSGIDIYNIDVDSSNITDYAKSTVDTWCS